MISIPVQAHREYLVLNFPAFDQQSLLFYCSYWFSSESSKSLILFLMFQKWKMAWCKSSPVPGVTFHIRHKSISINTSGEVIVRKIWWISPQEALVVRKHFLVVSNTFLHKSRKKSITVQTAARVLLTQVISQRTSALTQKKISIIAHGVEKVFLPGEICM